MKCSLRLIGRGVIRKDARAAVTYSLGLSEVRFQVRHGLCFCDFI